MALTFTSKIGLATRAWKLGRGLKIAQIEMTVGATGDYSSGFDIAGNASKMGFSRVFDVLSATVRQSNDTLRLLTPLYDVATGKLRLFGVTSAAAIPLEEITPGSDLAANDIVRMIVIGV